MSGISVYCIDCGRELQAPGALIFSPPDDRGRTHKHHVCVRCWPTHDPSRVGAEASTRTDGGWAQQARADTRRALAELSPGLRRAARRAARAGVSGSVPPPRLWSPRPPKAR